MSGVYAKLVRDPLAIASLGVIVGMILLGIFAPWIAPHDPIATNLALKFAPWGGAFPLGSDHWGGVLPRVFFLAFVPRFF
ncbi:MAG: hypothetical protein LRY68_01510 [Sulfurospirillum sp.]|nr:hypothetical protein [Sulfurospirillum sp.]